MAKSSSWSLPALGDRPGEQMEKSVRRVLTVLLPVVLETAVAADAALDDFRSKLLVVGNDLTLEGRIGCRIAAKRGVPTAVFMHGSIAGDPLQSRHIADRIFVNGSIHVRELAEQSVPTSKVVVCGAPNLDNRPRQTGLVHALLQARLGLQTGRPWILVATSGPGHRISHKHHQTVIENLARLSAELPDVPVVVKLHRKDRLEYYQQALKDQRHRLILVREESTGFPRGIFEWLTGCSVVLTGASTVGVEAMLMDVPVITMDFCQEIHGVDFIDAGATTHVQTADALRDAVRHCLASGTTSTGQAVRKYLGEAYFALDGRSSDRAAASLMEIAGA
jgi:UDP-N-acetylglucosamine 2-epimerase